MLRSLGTSAYVDKARRAQAHQHTGCVYVEASSREERTEAIVQNQEHGHVMRGIIVSENGNRMLCSLAATFFCFLAVIPQKAFTADALIVCL